MQFFTLALSALALVTAASAAPTASPQKRFGGNGQATYFYQNGAAGSCGNYNSDEAVLVAVNSDQMSSSMCGQKISIQGNGKTIEAVVADTCPTCAWGDLDLSVGAFKQLSDLNAGEVPITWWS